MYKHPPITEAVFGINFRDELSEAEMSALRSRLAEYYPTHQPIENLSLSVEINSRSGEEKKTANTQIHAETAHRLGTTDLSELVVLLPKAIVLSQMAPYPGWEAFFGRFVRDWRVVRRVLGFRELSRIGVRYINRIDIPVTGPIVDHESYLNLYPMVTDKYGPINAYAIQTEIFMEDMKCKLLLNSGVVPSPLLNTTSFLLDQDISCELQVPQRDEELFSLLMRIRDRKNDVFEACVTDKARGLFAHVR